MSRQLLVLTSETCPHCTTQKDIIGGADLGNNTIVLSLEDVNKAVQNGVPAILDAKTKELLHLGVAQAPELQKMIAGAESGAGVAGVADVAGVAGVAGGEDASSDSSEYDSDDEISGGAVRGKGRGKRGGKRRGKKPAPTPKKKPASTPKRKPSRAARGPKVSIYDMLGIGGGGDDEDDEESEDEDTLAGGDERVGTIEEDVMINEELDAILDAVAGGADVEDIITSVAIDIHNEAQKKGLNFDGERTVLVAPILSRTLTGGESGEDNATVGFTAMVQTPEDMRNSTLTLIGGSFTHDASDLMGGCNSDLRIQVMPKEAAVDTFVERAENYNKNIDFDRRLTAELGFSRLGGK